MEVKCFECDQTIQAPDIGALADAFVSHGKQVHNWDYPEEALRNYTGNFAEARERLKGAATERLPVLGNLSVRRVGQANVADWLDFFDHDGFAGNPDWASCYCLEPHVPATPELPERAWRQTRATMAERFRSGTSYGYLAYVEEKPAGWVNASLRSAYGLYKSVDPKGPPAATVIGVSCFVIAPPHRRHGVASTLLDHVIAQAPGRGAAWIEAYPHNAPDQNDAGHFRGPRALFDTRGFEVVEVLERYTVVRKAVQA